MADFYHTLEVPRSATLEEVRRSYKRLVKVWHPDKNPDNLEEATSKFKEIQIAFQVLSDNNQRAVYDDIIRNGEQRSNCADRAASNSNGSNVSKEEQGKKDKWANVRAEQSKREGRSTRVKHSLFGSVLRKNKHFGSVGDDLDGRGEKDQEFDPGKSSKQSNVTSRDVFRRHSILNTLRSGKQQSRAESGERDQQQDTGDCENHSRQTPSSGREAKYRRAGLFSSFLRTGSFDT